MNRIKKLIIPLFIFVFSSLASYAQNDCIVALLANDLSSSTAEFKTTVKQSEGFQAWQLLNKEKPALRSNIEELNLVSKNLDDIKNTGGYLKWKALQGVGKDKIWSTIDEVYPAYFEGVTTATLHKIILNDGKVVDVGYSLTRNNVLEFYINIPENLQNQGVFKAIYESAKTEYSFTKIKGWWKTSGNYTSGESTNLTIFKQKIAEGLTPQAASFETPTGARLQRMPT